MSTKLKMPTKKAAKPRYPRIIDESDEGKLVAHSRSSITWMPAIRKKCYPCQGRGKHLVTEGTPDDRIHRAWVQCSCCNGSGIAAPYYDED